MSRPNIDQKWEDLNEVLFQCECHGGHYLEVFHDKDEDYPDQGLWFAFKDYPNSLWATLKWWWQQRGLWQSETELSYNDVVKLRDTINEYIKFQDDRKKNDKQKKPKSPFKLVARIEEDIDTLGYSRDYYDLLISIGKKDEAEKYKLSI